MKTERGFATLLVLAFIALVGALVIVNGNAILHLRTELQQIDRHQQQRLHGQNPRH